MRLVRLRAARVFMRRAGYGLVLSGYGMRTDVAQAWRAAVRYPLSQRRRSAATVLYWYYLFTLHRLACLWDAYRHRCAYAAMRSTSRRGCWRSSAFIAEQPVWRYLPATCDYGHVSRTGVAAALVLTRNKTSWICAPLTTAGSACRFSHSASLAPRCRARGASYERTACWLPPLQTVARDLVAPCSCLRVTFAACIGRGLRVTRLGW